MNNINYLGNLSAQKLARIYYYCDIGLAVYGNGSNVDMPDKFYDYSSCGLVVLSSLKGELKDVIEENNLGYYMSYFFILNKNNFVCRALDNRMGGFMIAEVARLLKENKKQLPFGLYITNSVQEEIGLRGAEMITHTIKPDIAIVTDVCHDTTTPMIDKKKEGETISGAGPVISYAPAIQNNLRELVVATATKNKIPFQRLAASRATGTDTDAFAYSNGGVPSALISLALRYMHTTVEMVHKDDVENVIKLIYETLLSIKDGESFSYFK